MTESGYLPIEIMNRIKEFIPKDREMSSSTAMCIKSMLHNYIAYNDNHYFYVRDPYEPDENQEINYTSFPDYETYAEYSLRINREEMRYHTERYKIDTSLYEIDSSSTSDSDSD